MLGRSTIGEYVADRFLKVTRGEVEDTGSFVDKIGKFICLHEKSTKELEGDKEHFSRGGLPIPVNVDHRYIDAR